MDETAGLDDAVSDVRDHRFRHGPFEHYGGDQPWESVGDRPFDHHGPDPIAQFDETLTAEAEERFEHVREHVDVEQLVFGPQARQLSRHC